MQSRDIHALDNVKGGEKNELCFIIEAHAFDMRFQDFKNLFTVLKRVMSVNSEESHQTIQPTLAVP